LEINPTCLPGEVIHAEREYAARLLLVKPGCTR